MRGKDLSTLDWQPTDSGDDPSGFTAYTATDNKGNAHFLCRNNHRPEYMFVISDGMKCQPGWYTDKDGPIRRVS
jgi:hypothetical protein